MMPRESKIIQRLREVKVFNPYKFYGSKLYIFRRTPGYRDVRSSAWMVTKRGKNLSDWWGDYGSKSFIINGRQDAQRALAEAQKWASDKFGVKEWARDPFGSYGEKAYIEKRLKELLGERKKQ